MTSEAKDQLVQAEKSAAKPKNPEAEALKEEGNKYFAEKHATSYYQAIICYSKAHDLDPTNPVYLSNRSFCHLRLEEYGSAIEDATAAIAADPRFVKAYYRRGTALFALAKLKDARKDFQKVLKMLPRDKDASAKLNEIEKELRKLSFLKAIENEHTKPISETLNLNDIEVEDSYSGPRLADGMKVTAEFLTELMDWFKAEKRLHKRYVYEIVMQALKIFRAMPSLYRVPVPEGSHITVCGDVHGQYYDVLNLFKLNGLPSPTNPYLFNGDFVDRGSFSVEVIIVFFAFKILYPNSFHMNRGNHESLNMNSIYGFQGEVVAKVDSPCFELFTECFNNIPLAAVVGEKVLVVHGGLFAEDGVTLDRIAKINRVQQPPESGLMCELLWSDPQVARGRGPSKRGVALAFGPDVTKQFLDENNLSMIVRSHEVKEDGYEVQHDDMLVTVFSAPNYCGQMGNKGAYIRFESDMKPNYITFTAVPSPNVRAMAYASQAMFQGF